MRVLTLAFVAAALLTSSNTIRSEETPVKSKIVSVGLFKNGLAVIKREVSVEGAGVYRLEDVPEPVHGTYWVESTCKVETAVEMRELDTPAHKAPELPLQEELAGKKVTIHFRDGKTPPVTGTVAKQEPRRGELASSRGLALRGYYGEVAPAPSAPFLIVQTARGRTYVNAGDISAIDADGTGEKVRVRRPVLLLTVSEPGASATGGKEQKPATFFITYLARGLSWAPNYRVDISDPKNLTLEQFAVVKNELTDLDGAEVKLISGYPSVKMALVTSPLSTRTNWTRFFQELTQRSDLSDGISNIAQGQVLGNAYAPSAVSLGATPAGEGVDLHYESIGKRSLKEGDSLGVSVARGKASYERIVEWLVQDTRDEFGRPTGRSNGGDDPDGDPQKDTAWDALRFKNPFSFPMTTAPAAVTANGQFNGQRMSFWVNAGEETVLRVTKALSVRTRSVENEEQKGNGADRAIVYVGGREFRKANVAGELAVSNHRKEEIKLVIRRRFSGDLVSADAAPKVVLREEGVYAINKRNEMLWTITLKPGEEKKLNYRYAVLVAN